MAQEKIKICEFATAGSSSQTAVTSFSDVPYGVAAWRSEVISGYFINWGNTNNQVIITLQWGVVKEGEYPSDSTGKIFWIDDTSLTATVLATAGIAVAAPFTLTIPSMKGLLRRLKFTLSGTAQTFDCEIYSYPDSSIGLLLGQQVAGASMPVVLTAAQLTTLTPISALTNYALETGGNLASIKAGTPVALGAQTIANSSAVNIASDQTVPVSSLAIVSQGTVLGTTANILSAGSVSTSSPVYVNGQISPLSIDTGGKLRVNTQGATASGAANGGNPNKIGGVFNTLQPTATNSQTIDAQFTARGATLVATGVDPLNVNVPSGTFLNTYSVLINTNATTTPTALTAYISSITVATAIAGTTSTLAIQDKQGTPLKLINGLTTVAITTTPTILNFQTPIKMVSGIDIITAGGVSATVNAWINYYQ